MTLHRLPAAPRHPGIATTLGDTPDLTPARREALGELHLRRIDVSDEVRVVSESGYLGSATRREIACVRKRCKSISSMDPILDL